MTFVKWGFAEKSDSGPESSGKSLVSHSACSERRRWHLPKPTGPKTPISKMFLGDLVYLSPLRCKAEGIKYNTTTWLCLSSSQTFLMWREMTVPDYGSLSQEQSGSVKHKALSERKVFSHLIPSQSTSQSRDTKVDISLLPTTCYSYYI